MDCLLTPVIFCLLACLLMLLASTCIPAALQEFYGDFVALDVHHFMVPVPTNEVLINPKAALPLGASE
jgi:hypothetical protein